MHYPDDQGRELHAVYHLTSMTFNRRIRVEVSIPDADPHIPSIVAIYPTNDWHERETFDMFGIIFDGHPALTRILMPDDWPGHPQRKDYPLGGIPVEYKGGIHPAARRAEVLQLMSTTEDIYAGSTETTEGKVFTVSGQDWDQIVSGLAEEAEERVVVNMGPQHPSTHGVLRLILELEGETVTEARCGIGYLHTGIEKNMEYRSWVQGVTFCTRMDYLSPFYNEATYVLGVERLLDIEDQIPEKAQVMRVLLMELNRISSHLVCIATGGMEIGALTVMTIGFRERELVLDLFELITGLRMNHAFFRPGGVAQDLPVGALDEIRGFVALMKKRLPEYAALCNANPIFKARLEGVGHLDLEGCLALGLTGPAAPRHRLPVGPAQELAVLRLRGLRLRRPDLGHLRLLRPVPGAARRDARVAEDRRAGRRPAGAARGRPGHGGRQEDRLAEPARDRQRRHGQQPRPHPPHHGRVDGGADPPLQAGHRGLPGAARPGLRAGRVARAASSAPTSSPTAAPVRSARTSATRRSPTCRPPA